MKYFFIFILFFNLLANAQHFRGMHVINDNLCFISGSKGYVLKIKNNKVDTISPLNCKDKDFRDIYAYSEKEIIIMSSGKGGFIYKTFDGGKNWKLVFEDTNRNVFLDGMDFNKRNGFVIGDPIENHFYYLSTIDKGNSWKKEGLCRKFYDTVLTRNRIIGCNAIPMEALFAASGTSVLYKNNYQIFVTGGGIYARIWNGYTFFPLPLVSGVASGAYTAAVLKNNIIVMGGNYTKTNARDSICCFSTNNGAYFEFSDSMPMGYRSCVCINPKTKIAYCTGTNGTDISVNLGRTWRPTKIKGYNVCACSKNYLWLAGNKNSWMRIKITDVVK